MHLVPWSTANHDSLLQRSGVRNDNGATAGIIMTACRRRMERADHAQVVEMDHARLPPKVAVPEKARLTQMRSLPQHSDAATSPDRSG